MSFQFVNVTPDNTEHDAETRRRIRSQVMRDYRRRQRVEEGSTPSSPEKSQSSNSSPYRSSESRSRQESRRRKSSTPSIPIRPEAPCRQSSGTSREEPPPSRDNEVAERSRRSSQSTGDRRDSLRRQSRREEPRAQLGVFGTFTIQLPQPKRSPREIYEDIDPLSSPDQLEHVISICESYNRWLIASMPVEAELGKINGPWDTPTSQMLLFASCLKSIGHLDALRPAQVEVDRRLLKTKVLALANKRLKNPANALEDRTIEALACLTSYEVWHPRNESTSKADLVIDIEGIC